MCRHATAKVKRAPQAGFVCCLVSEKPLAHPEETSPCSASWDSTSRARRVLGNPLCLSCCCCWFAFEILLCSTGAWPHPAPQPDLPQAPLDVVVMVKCHCDHGAICPCAAEQGLSSSSSSSLVNCGAHYAQQVMSVVQHTCPDGLASFHSVCLHEGCKVGLVFLLL